MIERIHLQNFKACRDIEIRIAPLTVLAGLNSSGKSTILQSIALLRQSYAASGHSDELMLHGELLHLGHGRDILSEGAEGAEDAIVFEFQEDGSNYRWVCPSMPAGNELHFRESPQTSPGFAHSSVFQFIQADRVTPATLFPQAHQRTKAVGFLGARGENTADYIAQNQDFLVPEARWATRSNIQGDRTLLVRVAPTGKLLDQVAAWCQHLSPGARMLASRVDGTDDVLLRFNYIGIDRAPKSNDYRPTNVGFGLTYCMPILVACLVATPGSLLLLENPEAHLHPQGQVALGELLSLAVADGVQILVETHSDHLLNGIRLAVKRECIPSDKVALHFFTRRVDTGASSVETPTMLRGGKLSDWPTGFFDQWDRSMDSLVD